TKGTHNVYTGGALTGTYITDDHLMFVAAGAAEIFNGIPMGPYSFMDITIAGAPVVSPTDGLAARYKLAANDPDGSALSVNTTSTVSIHFDVPFTVSKG